MADFKQTAEFDFIEATSISGETVALYVRHSHESYENIVMHSFRPVPMVKKSTDRIIDVSGDKDGAGSIVKMHWNRMLSRGESEEVRIRETPQQLRDVFAKAGVDMPETSKSWGRVFRDIRDGMFGRPKDPSIDPS